MTDDKNEAPPPVIYILTATNDQVSKGVLAQIRKWDREPFEGGIPHLYVPQPHDAEIVRLRDALSEVVDGFAAHDFPGYFGITEERGREIRALAGLTPRG